MTTHRFRIEWVGQVRYDHQRVMALARAAAASPGIKVTGSCTSCAWDVTGRARCSIDVSGTRAAADAAAARIAIVVLDRPSAVTVAPRKGWLKRRAGGA
jgi:hypothetical protein